MKFLLLLTLNHPSMNNGPQGCFEEYNLFILSLRCFYTDKTPNTVIYDLHSQLLWILVKHCIYLRLIHQHIECKCRQYKPFYAFCYFVYVYIHLFAFIFIFSHLLLFPFLLSVLMNVHSYPTYV